MIILYQGDFHPSGAIDIPDPIEFTDKKGEMQDHIDWWWGGGMTFRLDSYHTCILGYDKCYWMIYKSMQNFVKHLKKEEEEQQQQKKKPRLIKLPDPTVFTISSPSAWQKRNLSSPPIFPVELSFQGI